MLGLVEAQGSGSSSISTGGDRGGLLFLPRRFIHSLILTLLGSPVFSVVLFSFNHHGSQSARMADDRDRLGLGGPVPDLCNAPRRGSPAQESRLRHGRLLELCVYDIDDCHVGRTDLM